MRPAKRHWRTRGTGLKNLVRIAAHLKAPYIAMHYTMIRHPSEAEFLMNKAPVASESDNDSSRRTVQMHFFTGGSDKEFCVLTNYVLYQNYQRTKEEALDLADKCGEIDSYIEMNQARVLNSPWL